MRPATDSINFNAHVAGSIRGVQLGAYIIKVKLPPDYIEQDPARKVYEQYDIPHDTLVERAHHVVQSTFNGRRIVIFSGGVKKDDDTALLDEAKAIRDGGGFGSIMGRNTFQQNKNDALT